MGKLKIIRLNHWGVFEDGEQLSYDCTLREEAIEWLSEERERRKKQKLAERK